VLIGFFSEHTEGMSRGKKYYKTTLCYLASGSFFWRGFLFCVLACSSFIPALYFGGINVLQCVPPAKTMTIKTDCNNAEGFCVLALCVSKSLSRACGSALFSFVLLLMFYSVAGLCS
jgi:hypothetical protein